MALSIDDTNLLEALTRKLSVCGVDDIRHDAYYEGSHRLEQLGLSVSPNLRLFETVVNWPRVCVDALEERIDVKSLMLPGVDIADPGLQDGWDVNNLDSESSLVHLDSLIHGRGFVSVGSPDEPGELPMVSVESPREVAVIVDPRQRRVSSALKLYGETDLNPEPQLATLYQPDVTVWLEKSSMGRGWVEYDRDQHNLGRVPVVPFLNRRRTGRWLGVSEMVDVIPLADSAARFLTRLEVAGETLAVPQKYALGLTKGDFVDADGNPLPVWEAYYGAIWATSNADAKVGQFAAADLSGFTDTVNHYAQLVAGLTGLPMRYLGQNTANPPSADGIRADEARLVKRAERKAQSWGDQWGRVFAFFLRFRDGEWVSDGSRIKVEWHDAATPTYAAKVDGIQKLTGGKPILSQQGGWDELGWSEARKERERQYQADEAADPLIADLLRPQPPAQPPDAGFPPLSG